MSEPAPLQRFLAELKRRRVFRVMAVYGVVGFIVLQVVDLAVPALLLPEWTYRLVAFMLLVGFPVAIVLAWAFEMTPSGVRRTRAASPGEIEQISQAPASARWPIGVAALAGAVLLGLGAWWVLGREADAGTDGRVYDSIAVLPFVNMTGQEGVEYLGEGLAEELRNALVRIEGLKVPSMTSAAAFGRRGADIRTIGDSLDVDVVLEGSVRGSGGQLRITAQLIDAEDDHHVWSDTYSRPVGNDLLALQTNLTERIVAALSERLDARDVGSVAARGTDSTTAYEYYLKGRYFWNKRTFEDMKVAIGFFEDAIRVDSSYAPAYAAIADAYVVPTGWGDDPGHALDEAERYARLALDIDPTLAEAHTALGFTYMTRDLDFGRAERSYARAIELDDDYATAHQWFAELLSAMHRHDEALAEVRKAEALDPTPIISWNVSRILYFAGSYEEAIARIDGGEAVLKSSDPGRDLSVLVPSLYALGDFDQLADLIERMPLGPEAPPGAAQEATRIAGILRTAPEQEARRTIARLADRLTSYDAPKDVAAGLAALAWVWVEPDSALARLEVVAAHPDRVGARIGWFNVLADAAFAPLRDDPRFQELNARFGH